MEEAWVVEVGGGSGDVLLIKLWPCREALHKWHVETFGDTKAT